MHAFIFRADIYCTGCATSIRHQIEGNHPEDVRHPDSDRWPQYAGDNGGGEADSPQHCRACGTFLENPLTDIGEKAVAVAIEAHDRHGYGDPSAIQQWRAFYAT